MLVSLLSAVGNILDSVLVLLLPRPYLLMDPNTLLLPLPPSSLHLQPVCIPLYPPPSVVPHILLPTDHSVTHRQLPPPFSPMDPSPPINLNSPTHLNSTTQTPRLTNTRCKNFGRIKKSKLGRGKLRNGVGSQSGMGLVGRVKGKIWERRRLVGGMRRGGRSCKSWLGSICPARRMIRDYGGRGKGDSGGMKEGGLGGNALSR